MPSDDAMLGLLRDLVAIDSVNPSLVSGAAGELAIARRVAEEMRAIGLEVQVAEVAAGRPNVVGVLRGATAGRTLLLCGHTDTVGVAGMHRPFEPHVRDGRLYGRGSQDMKGGLAAMLSAARRVVDAGGLPAGELLVAAVVDEEHSSLGAEALARSWHADTAVVTEPTGLDVAVAHKGFEWVAVETRGRAAHGSRPQEGRDAILRMGRVLSRLEALEQTLRAGRTHALLGHASLHASLIHGGQELSSYPDRARLELERRTLPGESTMVAVAEVDRILEDLRELDPEFEADRQALLARGAYEIDPESSLPGDLVDVARHAGCSAAIVGMSFWTDAAILGAAGIPTVLFGPGGAGLHSTEEYVLVDDVERCAQALVALTRRTTSLR
ncbi:MAG TPA: M20/M25/M40 family metallo-hydrolase [Vicinamibacterales bacterium]